MKKLLSLVLAAVISACICAAFPAAVFADAPDAAATYCFDNGNRLTDWEFYGAAEEVNLRLDINGSRKESGAGSLAVSQKIIREITENKSGGVQITADKLGLENFAGCTMKLSYFYGEDAALLDSFTVFSAGVVWIQTSAPRHDGKRPQWQTVSVTVPDNANNNRFGFTIPTYKTYSGISVYIDNLYIYDKDGNAIANLGDFEQETVTSFFRASIWSTIGYAALLILFIGIIAASVVFYMKKLKKRYR